MIANRPYVLGLTGGIGCGKSEAAAQLTRLGAAHADADAISRALTAPGGAALPELRSTFGDGVFTPEGTLDRQAMASLIFSDPDRRRQLEGILHPAVLRELERITQTATAPVVLWDVPLLFETGMDRFCDGVWVLTAPVEVQLERVMQRGLTREQALKRIASQLTNEERAARATRVICTDRPVEETRAELTALYETLLNEQRSKEQHGSKEQTDA